MALRPALRVTRLRRLSLQTMTKTRRGQMTIVFGAPILKETCGCHDQ
jgi:hypothetical protein